MSQTYILGAGMTGLSAGYISGLPILEGAGFPGGICSSYYIRPGEKNQLHNPSEDGEVYRFEIGGGHWIFGGDPIILQFIHSLTPLKSYTRSSAVYLPDQKTLVPYPIQNHLKSLGETRASQSLTEITESTLRSQPVTTMEDCLKVNFGPTLGKMFFEPFHELYTAGLWKTIAPQDAYKSPISFPHLIRGAFERTPSVGYNASFRYPEEGLNALSQSLARQCQIHYNKKIHRVDGKTREIHLADGSKRSYHNLISTLPLNRILDMAGLKTEGPSNPSSSVLVINVGAFKEKNCPPHQWLYMPKSRAGFHRVGFYSHVDTSFLPTSSREVQNKVSIYIEKAYRDGEKPSLEDIDSLCQVAAKNCKNGDGSGRWKFLTPHGLMWPIPGPFPITPGYQKPSRLWKRSGYTRSVGTAVGIFRALLTLSRTA